MSDEELPAGADVDRIHERLSEGLKSCRTMITNYKSLLTVDRSEFASTNEADLGPIGHDPKRTGD